MLSQPRSSKSCNELLDVLELTIVMPGKLCGLRHVFLDWDNLIVF
jgi:hypothetical protein